LDVTLHSFRKVPRGAPQAEIGPFLMDLVASAQGKSIRPASGASRGSGPLLYQAWRRILQSEDGPAAGRPRRRWRV